MSINIIIIIITVLKHITQNSTQKLGTYSLSDLTVRSKLDLSQKPKAFNGKMRSVRNVLSQSTQEVSIAWSFAPDREN